MWRCTSQGAGAAWSQLTSLTTGRSSVSAVVHMLAGRIYVLGGFDGQSRYEKVPVTVLRPFSLLLL